MGILAMNAAIPRVVVRRVGHTGHVQERACDVNPERTSSTRREAVASLALAVASTTTVFMCPRTAGADVIYTDGTSVYSSAKMGFRFEYPSSFVVAFDRTDSYAPRNIPTDEDVALTSVGSYSKSFVTVTVFGKRVREDTNGSTAGKDFFYERVIRPVVDSPTTIGFSLTRESVAGGDGGDGGDWGDAHYDFEFEHSVCRGETIEEKAGALRCIGNFGQDLPVQSRYVWLISLYSTPLLARARALANDSTFHPTQYRDRAVDFAARRAPDGDGVHTNGPWRCGDGRRETNGPGHRREL